MGKERTTSSGEFENLNPMFVKSIDAGGHVTHHNWTSNYMKVRSRIGIQFPGYVSYVRTTSTSKKTILTLNPRNGDILFVCFTSVLQEQDYIYVI